MIGARCLHAMIALAGLAGLACRTPSPAALVAGEGDGEGRANARSETGTAAASLTSAEPAMAQAASAETTEAPRTLPTSCSEGATCVPPAEFSERLCAGLYPEVALHMFAPKTPWKRAYLLRSFQAWHVGGHGDMRELRANEEVLIVSAGRGTGAQAMVGGQPFDVLRWDGTCVSLMEDELSFKKPGGAVPANIAWKKLEPAFQSLFGGEKNIESARANQVRLCEDKAAEREPGKTKCELARRQLSLVIAQFVGRGAALPPLTSIP